MTKEDWKDCTDENYWETQYDIVWFKMGDDSYVMSRNECRYGWNVLVRNNAKFLTPVLPE